MDAEGEYEAVKDLTVGMQALANGKLYNIAWDGMTIVNTADSSVSSLNLKGEDGKAFAFSYPYGIAVHPVNGDIYISDANFTGDSKVLCCAADGSFKWSQTTGLGSGPLLVY